MDFTSLAGGAIAAGAILLTFLVTITSFQRGWERRIYAVVLREHFQVSYPDLAAFFGCSEAESREMVWQARALFFWSYYHKKEVKHGLGIPRRRLSR